MKITVEPQGEPIDSLDDLAALVHRAQAMVAASGTMPTEDAEPVAVHARVRLAASAQVRAIEVEW